MGVPVDHNIVISTFSNRDGEFRIVHDGNLFVPEGDISKVGVYLAADGFKPTTGQFKSANGSIANGAIKSPAWTTRSTPILLNNATARLTFGILSWLSDITPSFILKSSLLSR